VSRAVHFRKLLVHFLGLWNAQREHL
jgi:hypothetical protein